MKERSFDFRQIEWWITTLVFVSIVLFNLIAITTNRSSSIAPYDRIFVPTALYVVFYIFHMLLIPTYLKNRKIGPLVGWGILTFGLAFLFSSILTVSFGHSFEKLFQLFMGVIFLYISHQGGALVLRNMLTPPRLSSYYFYNLSRMILTFIVLIFFLLLGQNSVINEGVLILFIMIFPVLFSLVLYNYYLVYGNRKAGKNKQANWYLALLLVIVFFVFFAIAAGNNQEEIILIGFLINGIILLIINPLSNLIFKKIRNPDR